MPRIAFQGAANVRDLGGIATTDGRMVQSDQVVRADSLSRLVNAGDLAGFLSVIGDVSKQRELLGDGKAGQYMGRINREFVSDDGYRQQFARALIIADDSRRPVLFHCTAGKDRTGWMAAIVLTALGVPRETRSPTTWTRPSTRSSPGTARSASSWSAAWTSTAPTSAGCAPPCSASVLACGY